MPKVPCFTTRIGRRPRFYAYLRMFSHPRKGTRQSSVNTTRIGGNCCKYRVLPRERPPAPRLVAPLSHGRPVSESQEAFCMVKHRPPETRANRHFHPSRVKRPFLTPKKHLVRKNTRKKLDWLVWLAGLAKLGWAGLAGWLARQAGMPKKPRTL